MGFQYKFFFSICSSFYKINVISLNDSHQESQVYHHCICAPPIGGRDWKIHPWRSRFPETREISRGRSLREILRVEGNLEKFPAAMGFAPRDPRDS